VSRVIDDAGDGDYTLLVTDDGDLEARKRIPYDGVRYYTTASQLLPTGRRTKSRYGLDVEEVIEEYRRRSDTDRTKAELQEATRTVRRAVMTVCDVCGEAASTRYRFELEWPREDPSECADPDHIDHDRWLEDPGRAALRLCGDCADAWTSNILVERAVERGLGDVYAGLAGAYAGCEGDRLCSTSSVTTARPSACSVLRTALSTASKATVT
jgi:hypothetical protein